MLSDVDIRAELGKGIIIEPFEESSLTPVGYDLRVGTYAFSWKNTRELSLDEKGPFIIAPHDTILVETYESIRLSRQFGGTIHSIVSFASAHGLAHISTTIDPGWEGKLLIQLHNYSERGVPLKFREPFCTVCFYKMESAAEKGHGRDRNREDIRTWLWTVAEEARAGERRPLYRSRKFWLIVAALMVIGVGVGTYFINPNLVIPLITILGVASLFVIEMLKPG